MDIEFDTSKDKANIAKHGVSLARTVELAGIVVVEDKRFDEPRFRLYFVLDGSPLRGGDDARRRRSRDQSTPRSP